jgi:hypothetical protein
MPLLSPALCTHKLDEERVDVEVAQRGALGQRAELGVAHVLVAQQLQRRELPV